MSGLTRKQAVEALVGATLLREDATGRGDGAYGLYAWRPGSDDVKLIAAVNDESAVRIAVQIRVDGGMSEEEALKHVCRMDDLRRVDPDVVVQGGPGVALWGGLQKVGWAVQKA